MIIIRFATLAVVFKLQSRGKKQTTGSAVRKLLQQWDRECNVYFLFSRTLLSFGFDRRRDRREGNGKGREKKNPITLLQDKFHSNFHIYLPRQSGQVAGKSHFATKGNGNDKQKGNALSRSFVLNERM